MKLKAKKILEVLPVDPVESARSAGLRYVSGWGPGIRRKKVGKSFTYTGPDGKAVKDPETLRRIRSLAIPPAWTDVWICPLANGHLQAVGRDAKGRRQYRYHPLYRKVRDETKFGRMIAFAAALPAIRKRVAEDLSLPGLPKQKVLATIVRLLETTFIRVGNEEYARENDSYGLTTFEDRHVRINGSKLRFRFRGKSGQEHDIEMDDPKLARVVKQCRDLPGFELFQYLDDDGSQAKIGSEDVNEYLREITGEDFTAKDFRTWAGTILAARSLVNCGECDLATETKKRIIDAVKEVAGLLGNRPATCRKYYIHPAILDAYGNRTLASAMSQEVKEGAAARLHKEELCVLAVIQQHLESALPALKKSA